MRYGPFRTAIAVLWLGWLAYWWLSARNVKATRWHESALSQLGHRIPLMLAAILLIAPNPLPAPANGRFLPASALLAAVGTIVLAAGLAFTVWARRTLGSNWSADVTLKVNHTLVRGGPYRYVRHPIYTGILVGFVGTGIVIGEWRGVVALGLVFIAFVYKSRIEERRMRETFPEYAEYQRHTAALIPFVY